MKGDGPCTIIIRGVHRGHPLTATWSKQTGKAYGQPSPIWSLTIQYRGRQRRFAVDAHEKPCWTVSLQFVNRVVPPPGKPYVRDHAKQIGKEMGFGIVGV